MVTLAAIAVALGLYYAFDKQKPVPTVPNSVNNNGADNFSQSKDGGVLSLQILQPWRQLFQLQIMALPHFRLSLQ